MNDRIFDNIIKSKLIDFDLNQIPQWDRMESMVVDWESMEQMEQDELFDQQINEKFEKFEKPFDEASWETLVQKMNHRSTIGRQIVYYQLSGAAILILLLMLLFQLYPLTFDQPVQTVLMSEKALISPELEKQTAKSDASTHTQFANAPSKGNENTIPAIQSTDNKAGGFLRTIPASQILDTSFGKLYFAQNHSSDIGGFSFAEQFGFLFRIDLPLFPFVQNDFNTPIQSDRENRYLNKAYYAREKLPDHFSGLFSKVFDLSQIDSYPIDFSIPKIDLASNKSGNEGNDIVLLSQEKDVGRSKKWLLSFFIDPQISRIFSPFDQLFDEPGYSRNVFSLGGGVGISRSIANFEISSGLVYQEKSFSPRLIEEELEDNSLIYLDKITYKIIKFPFRLKYDFYRKDGFKFYGATGVSVNAVVGTNYEIKKRNSGLLSLIEDLRINPAYKNTLLIKKDFEPGIIDGGETTKNLYATLDFGIGMEKEINKRLSFFVEPHINIDITKKGIGPNDDIIHNFGLSSGMKVILN